MDINKILASDNLADGMKPKALREIAQTVIDDYDRDKKSRSQWESKYEEANKLALQMVEHKSSPWQGASNVKFPLITTAAIQFNARAYPFLMNNGQPVKCRIIGADPGGKKASQAARKSQYMNYQLMYEDESWEEDVDRMTMVLPNVGTAFKKSRFDPDLGHNVSELVLASDLVVNYWARSIEGTRATHRLKMTDRDVISNQRGGKWIDFTLPEATQDKDEIEQGEDERAGIEEPTERDPAATRLVLEQYTYLDLDKDGYSEPYIITLDWEAQKVLRIVANFTEEDVQRSEDKNIARLMQQAKDVNDAPTDPADPGYIDPMDRETILTDMVPQMERLKKKNRVYKITQQEAFTGYKFMPSPDGSSVYGLGFGVFLGPINRSVDTLINQLIDAGTLQNSNSGFIGRGARLEKGAMRFKRNEWKQVNVAGGNLRENIIPLPANAPSAVLFNLMNLLINYAERISSVNDMMSGQTPGQNTPATTSMAALEQGMKTFQGIFKRMHRSMRDEARKLNKLNYRYLDQKTYFNVMDGQEAVMREDFAGDAKDVMPASDPTSVTQGEQVMKAQFLSERAQSQPGYDPVKVEQRLHEAMNIPDSHEIFPVDEEGQLVNQPGPSMEERELELDVARLEMQSTESMKRAQRDDLVAEAEVELKLANAVLARAKATGELTEAGLAEADRAIAALKAKSETLRNERESKAQAGDRGVAGKP